MFVRTNIAQEQLEKEGEMVDDAKIDKFIFAVFCQIERAGRTGPNGRTGRTGPSADEPDEPDEPRTNRTNRGRTGRTADEADGRRTDGRTDGPDGRKLVRMEALGRVYVKEISTLRTVIRGVFAFYVFIGIILPSSPEATTNESSALWIAVNGYLESAEMRRGENVPCEVSGLNNLHNYYDDDDNDDDEAANGGDKSLCVDFDMLTNRNVQIYRKRSKSDDPIGSCRFRVVVEVLASKTTGTELYMPHRLGFSYPQMRNDKTWDWGPSVAVATLSICVLHGFVRLEHMFSQQFEPHADE
uniref:Uncharacterized protein n=1 Tax=Caenorhabditis japonica TaxID=281687 RepID=A0A8R1I155_CAEJA